LGFVCWRRLICAPNSVSPSLYVSSPTIFPQACWK